MLASFVMMTEVYNFFELMGDMIRNSSLGTMFTYLFFLSPYLIYRTLPISILVAVLVTLGVLSKQNEVTAFKACGVSLLPPRRAHPDRVSMLCSGALFAFNYSIRPLRQPQAGRASATSSRAGVPDVSQARPHLDHGRGLAHLLLPVLRSRPEA